MNSTTEITGVMEQCRVAGLELAAVWRRGDVLVLRPARLVDLPAPTTLTELGERLKASTGARWVALDIVASGEGE